MQGTQPAVERGQVHTLPRESVHLGRCQAERHGIFAVRDNRAGFDPHFADKLFGVFGRLHPADRFGGMGIGLALVDRVVERHGGRIRTEAEPGRCAVFCFHLADGACA